MLQGINILGFFERKSDRRFERADVKDYMVVFKNTTMPSFIIMLESESNAATIDLIKIDKLTKVETTIGAFNAVVTTSGLNKIITYNGSKDNDFDCGYYYLLVTIGAKQIFSEVFSIVEDTYGLFGINIQSSDITYNKTENLPYSNIEIDFYLRYDNIEIEHEGNEEGTERYFGDIPLFSAVSIKRKTEIYGTPQIYRMLAFVRVLKVNGSVKVTVSGDQREIYDTNVEVKEYNQASDTIIIIFSYKEFDFAASSNEI